MARKAFSSSNYRARFDWPFKVLFFFSSGIISLFILIFNKLLDGGSSNPALNTQLRQAVDQAIKRDMPNHTIQGILRKASAPMAAGASKLKRHFVEARVLNKVFMVCVLYTDRFAGDRMTIATLFRKSGAAPMDVRHMFSEKGVLEAVAPSVVEGSSEVEDEHQLEERCTVDAIEYGAEELEVLNVGERRVLVNHNHCFFFLYSMYYIFFYLRFYFNKTVFF